MNYSGVLRITNPKTLERWKEIGKYEKLIGEGFIYASGCGRFRREECNCCECKKK